MTMTLYVNDDKYHVLLLMGFSLTRSLFINMLTQAVFA